MNWTIAGIVLLCWLPVAAVLLLVYMYFRLCQKYIDQILRIFTEKPIFVIPRGEKPEHAEDVRLTTPDGITLAASYFKATSPGPRKGVILFGLEFGSNRWSAGPYCADLRAEGYDIFTYEPRNQGDSDKDTDYTSMQWVTDRDVTDCRTAVEYLKRRTESDTEGIGLYGISKGGSAGLAVAADDPFIRCCLTDGAFATYSTVLPYMRYWYTIYDKNYALHGLIHPSMYGIIGNTALRRSEKQLNVRYVSLEKAVAKLAPRPWLMIHGDKDSYIRPSMAKALYDYAQEPKDFWLVPGARHNQAIEIAGSDYVRRVVGFFDEFLSPPTKGNGARG